MLTRKLKIIETFKVRKIYKSLLAMLRDFYCLAFIMTRFKFILLQVINVNSFED